ncbi:hypothetical protein [Nocardioides sp.]|uniref:hypothetical protein n=1 Tax=Nocardioides sp. TaxID=35761 RepID=UPI003529AA93
MRDQAEDLRGQADELLARAEGVAWQGWAADAMRTHARDRVAALRTTATAHDDAAGALDHHAAEVDRLTALIAALEQRARRLIAAARDRLAALAHRLLDGLAGPLPDPLDQLLDRFVPPPSGHRDWLDVDLPGLHR